MIVNTREAGDVFVFDFEGDIKRSPEVGAPFIHKLVKARLEEGRRKILFNFEKVGIVDSFGVGEVLSSYLSIVDKGGRLKQAAISRRLRLIYEVTGLIKVFDVYEDVAAALSAFAEG